MPHCKPVCTLLITLIASNWLTATAMAQPAAGQNCPDAHFFRTRPAVPTPAVAKAIYKAIGSAAMGSYFARYPIIHVVDQGDKWAVYQSDNKPPPKPSPDSVTVTAGGGQFSLVIDKCTGAILDADANR